MISIDINAPTPLFEQLVQQIKAEIQRGSLCPKDPLPSIRQLAGDLDVNAKTVAKAYKLLERDGVIESKGYRGTHVHADARVRCEFELAPILISELGKCIQSLRARGATDTELRKTFNQLLNGELTHLVHSHQGEDHVGS